MPQSESLDFADDDRQTGYRLHNFEILNWGTFDQKIWSLQPHGDNALLTGDIGSGKSTLVDALTSLLVPARKITFNKAAGAGGKERSLRSYVLGYFKSEKDESSYKAKPVGLRKPGGYSVLLAQFHNQGFDKWLTLAQVFWLKTGESAPERFYVVAQRPLTIRENFSAQHTQAGPDSAAGNSPVNKGGDIQSLQRQLRKSEGVRLFPSFAQYSAEFRRRMGIENDQALSLFYQTVSMKTVGNLTDFVRTHMLEAPPIKGRIEQAVQSFNDLNRAHEAVLKAQRQIAQLQPLVEVWKAHQQLQLEIDLYSGALEHLEVFFNQIKCDLLNSRVAGNQQQLAAIDRQLAVLADDLQVSEGTANALRMAIMEAGGGRIQQLEADIYRLEQEKQRLRDLARRYQTVCRQLELDEQIEEDTFVENRRQAQEDLTQREQQRESLRDAEIELKVAFAHIKDQGKQLNEEVQSLKARETSIPRHSLLIRRRICDALELDDEQLPFVGELIQIRADALDWEGAIERVLHNLALSLLVPEHLYRQVAGFVDATHLKGRLVYYRVPVQIDQPKNQPAVDTLYLKIDLKADSAFYPWLGKELLDNFAYRCCADLESFHRFPKAMTRNGQTKSGKYRHEKNDRHDLTDRTRYVLGWSNQTKIEALETQLDGYRQHMTHLAEKISANKARQTRLQKTATAWHDLLQIDTFQELNWPRVVIHIDEKQVEIKTLEQSSEQLQLLNSQLRTCQEQIREFQQNKDRKIADHADLKARLGFDEETIATARAGIDLLPRGPRELWFARIETLREEAQSANVFSARKVSVEGCDHRRQEMGKWLRDNKLKSASDREKRRLESLIDRMRTFKDAHRKETEELDVSLQAAQEYQDILLRLLQEDLPRHQKRFQRMLRENTINEMALLNGELSREREAIVDKITQINQSLSALDYNDGTFIRLEMEPSPDHEIRQFREDLRNCLDDTLSADQDQVYSERKFQAVKALIDRFEGREGLSADDQRWTAKVSDVRNWCLFSVSERWREDGNERERYSDSSGKSGGQKEKLAYTILASALAYQFGLEWGETRSRSFRFVMIDEAFGRGSDESARYALELFKRLNLQLLIVTPLQKIHVIENYIQTVNFVHNPNGNLSMVRNLSIEQYRQEKNLYRDSSAEPVPGPNDNASH